ncbi:MAG: putative transcriptional regulator [Clostridiales bacterium]|jgi:transcriptional regulator with XRE-family HTH domain|nr:putative transcriptional regulator [Clostridiales bacterium]
MLLSELRGQKGLTQRELARDLHLGVSTIAMYESGKRLPSLKVALEIAKYFNVSVEDLSFKALISDRDTDGGDTNETACNL